MMALAPWTTEYAAYDVPRLWCMVRQEGGKDDAAHARTFAWLAALLSERLEWERTQWDRLLAVLKNSPSLWIAAMLAQRDTNIKRVDSSVSAYISTSRALDRIGEALAQGRRGMVELATKWDEVTQYPQNTWDSRAWTLNSSATKVMVQLDSAVRDNLPLITSPAVPHLDGLEPARHPAINAAPMTPPPPLEGTSPVQGFSATALPHGFPRVKAPAGGSHSYLPLPPGHELARRGGAYRLPRARSGEPGLIIELPEQAAGRRHTGREDSTFPVARGVDPVIGGAPPALDGPEGKRHKDFPAWFCELATPWLDTFPDPLLRRGPR